MTFVWVCLLAAQGLAQPVTTMPPEVKQAVEDTAQAPLAARMETISRAMVGQPYVLDPLGEGEVPDADPMVRYDAFDCLTFVEEVVALSMGETSAETDQIRQTLRYGSRSPKYIHRHHLMALQWLPSAQRNGWLVDRTAALGETHSMDRDITLETWAAWSQRAQFHHRDEELPLGHARLTVLPVERAREVMHQIPHGSLLLTVREDRSYRPVWVSHVGLVFHIDGTTYVRHATKLGEDQVKDHDLGWYLEHLKSYTHLPVAGVAVWEFVDADTPEKLPSPSPADRRAPTSR